MEINKFNIYINDVFFISLNPAAKGEKINYYKQRFYYMPKSSNNSIEESKLFFEICDLNFENEYFNSFMEKLEKSFPNNLSKEDLNIYLIVKKISKKQVNRHTQLRAMFKEKNYSELQEELLKYYKRLIFNFSNFLPNRFYIKEVPPDSLFNNDIYRTPRYRGLIPYIEELFDVVSIILNDILNVHYTRPTQKKSRTILHI